MSKYEADPNELNEWRREFGRLVKERPAAVDDHFAPFFELGLFWELVRNKEWVRVVRYFQATFPSDNGRSRAVADDIERAIGGLIIRELQTELGKSVNVADADWGEAAIDLFQRGLRSDPNEFPQCVEEMKRSWRKTIEVRFSSVPPLPHRPIPIR